MIAMKVFVLLFVASVVSASRRPMETNGMVDGDIQVSPDEYEGLINGTFTFGSIRGGRWPKGDIAYEINSNIGSNGRHQIDLAIKEYEKHTCLRFKRKTNERNYIHFQDGRGCNSPVGMSQYRRNTINLDRSGCQNKGTIMHEIGHSIGLYHEQNRPDRDQYVSVHYGNIDGNWDYAFHIQSSVDSLGTPYDFHSMMHYSSTAFAKRGKKTITTKDRSKQHIIDTYNRITGFSDVDVKQINLMYKSECGSRGSGGGGGGSGSGNCTDKDVSGNCGYWKNQGYCKQTHDTWMKKNCCGTCSS